MEEVPRRTSLTPLASPSFVLCFSGVETEGVLDYQGTAGIISIVWWNLRPVIFGVKTYDPGGHLKKSRSPARKSAEKVLREVPVRNGVPRKVPKKVLRAPRLCRGSIGDGARSTFFSTFLGTLFRTGTSRSTFSALFLAGASGLL